MESGDFSGRAPGTTVLKCDRQMTEKQGRGGGEECGDTRCLSFRKTKHSVSEPPLHQALPGKGYYF